MGRVTTNVAPRSGLLRARIVAHLSARLLAGGRELARFTAVAQRETEVQVPQSPAGHPPPQAPASPEASPETEFPHRTGVIGYHDLVELRTAEGTLFRGPCAIWFRLRHPLVEGETPCPVERVRGGRRFRQRHQRGARFPPLHLRELRSDDQPAAARPRRVGLHRCAHFDRSRRRRTRGCAHLRCEGTHRPCDAEPGSAHTLTGEVDAGGLMRLAWQGIGVRGCLCAHRKRRRLTPHSQATSGPTRNADPDRLRLRRP